MKPVSILKTLWLALIIVSLVGCNYPGAAPAAPEASPTTLPPTPTSPPPTEPPTPVPPTETPTLAPPTATQPPPPTQAPPTATRPAPTQAPIKPAPGAKFDGTFEGGYFTFRINSNSSAVIPKMLRIQKANCKEGKKMSDLLAFDPPPSFPIEDGKFTISRDTQLYMTGFFQTPTQARGSLEIKIKKEGNTCTIGPVAWIATQVE